MVNKIHIQYLLYAMSELMHGDVISFIIHARFRDACTQPRLFFAAHTRPGMSRTASRFYSYMMGNTACIFGIESHLRQQTRHIGSKRIGIGVQLAGLCTQRILVQACAGFEPVVPDVVRT